MLVAKKIKSALASVEGVPLCDLPVDDMWRASIKAKMKALGVGQAELAEHVGCAQGNISMLLNGKRAQVRSAQAERISVALDVPLTVHARGEKTLAHLKEKDKNLFKSMVENMEMVAGAIKSNDQ